jgi:hypothetical protein
MRTVIPTAGLCALLSFMACSDAEPIQNKRSPRPETAAATAQFVEPFRVENWYGTWTGTRPAYPLLNANGEVIVVRGKEAKVGSSTFTFTIGAMGTAELVQSHDDGRVAAFSGTWKGRVEPETNQLSAIVCDLTANSTGAYRQFALMADDQLRAVVCHGTSAEPPFTVSFVSP